MSLTGGDLPSAHLLDPTSRRLQAAPAGEPVVSQPAAVRSGSGKLPDAFPSAA
jgi:hypothetical protein